MEPMVIWALAALSGILLAAGGFLLARTSAARRIYEREEDLLQARATLKQLANDHQSLQHQHELLKEATLQDTGPPPSTSQQDTVRFNEDPDSDPTRVPDAQPYFERSSAQMQQVSDGELEIPKSAPPERDRGEVEADFVHEEKTRQFSVNSPESVVEFLQKIDDLEDKNRQLKQSLHKREEEVRGLRAEKGDRIQRTAEQDMVASKLRQELKRRDEKIKQLESRLYEEMGYSPPPPNEPQKITSVTVPAIPADAIKMEEVKEEEEPDILSGPPPGRSQKDRPPIPKFGLPKDGSSGKS